MPNETTIQQTVIEQQPRSPFSALFERNAVAITIAAISALTALLNLWSISKLAPITQDLAVLTGRVSAHDAVISGTIPRSEFNTVVDSIKYSISEWRDDNNNRLDRIERKIDTKN